MPAHHDVVFCLGEVICQVSIWHLFGFSDPAYWDWRSNCGLWRSGDFHYSGEYLSPYFEMEVRVTSFVFERNDKEFHPFIAKPVIKHG